jgi:hypothetical protein
MERSPATTPMRNASKYGGIGAYYITALCDVLLYTVSGTLVELCSYLTGTSTGASLFFSKSTTNLAAFVVLGLRPIT